jgi:hypothetical protein
MNFIEGTLPDWFISFPDVQKAIWNFEDKDFDFVAEFEIEFAQAWALAKADSEYISLTEAAEEFITEQDENGEDKFRPAEIIDSKIQAYGWEKLTDKKKGFLIQLIKHVYLERDINFEKAAEHFLTCIYLHPDTPSKLIEDYLLDIDSEVLKEAIAIDRL